jgi:hypothetical protein
MKITAKIDRLTFITHSFKSVVAYVGESKRLIYKSTTAKIIPPEKAS